MKKQYKPLRDPRKVKRDVAWAGGERRFLDRKNSSIEYVGCVVNPKDMRPYFVFGKSEEDGAFYLTVPTTDTSKLEIVGKGVFEPHMGHYSKSSEHFGAPRIHTTAGVSEVGTGLGTALYTGGCLMGSYLVAKNNNSNNESHIDSAFLQEPGCSSGPGANDFAKRWWKKAKNRRLVQSELIDIDVDREETTTELESTVEVSVSWNHIYKMSAKRGYFVEMEIEKTVKESVREQARSEIDGEVVSVDFPDTPLNIRIVSELPDVTATFSVKGEKGEEEIYLNFPMKMRSYGYAPMFLDRLKTIIDEQADFHFQRTDLDDLIDFEIESYTLTDLQIESENIDLEVDCVVNVFYVPKQAEDPVATIYLYPLEKALHSLLIIDMNETLVNAYGEEMPTGKSLLEVVLNLDLSEVLDPDVFPLFFGMAEAAGATQTQLRAFVNRTTLRGDLPRELIEREYVFDDLLGFKPGLEAKGVRVNPDLDFEAIGESIYGDLVDLD